MPKTKTSKGKAKEASKSKGGGGVEMAKVLVGGGLTAQRFAGKPLRQPGYSFRDVPKCTRDLSGSTLYEVTRREDFNDSMAEMVLLCNEVMRRQADARIAEAKKNNKKGPVKRTSKPLSLEYIADRMDVDDPISGFFVRSAATPAAQNVPAAPAVPAASAVAGAPNGPVVPADTNNEKPDERRKRRRACSQPTTANAQEVSPAPESRNQSGTVMSAVAPAPPPPAGWKEGMLQGFITVTTFTNWQKSFRWDSMHDSAFSYDDPALAAEMTSGVRKYDRDGSLAEAMQATVRCGDPWNEGIVWPHIAEISLLGALGCGRALVQLVVERLERMPPSGKRNYDFVVLQATDNSVSFYESMGFVRVGCITDNEDFKEAKEGGDNDETETEPESDNGEEKKDYNPLAEQTTSSSSFSKAKAADAEQKVGDPPPFEVVSSAVDVYTTTKEGQKISDIAKICNVNVWDIIFLNHYLYKHMVPYSKVKKGTELYVPAERARHEACSSALRNQKEHGGKSTAVQWYFSEDDEAPRDIATKFNLDCRELVQANRDRIPDLQPLSRLHENTRIKVSHFDVHNDEQAPYCHWTFPDDTLETSEPSYMMARKLNRKSGQAAKFRPVETSFAVMATKYELSKAASLASSEQGSAASSVPVETPGKQKGSRKRKREERHPDEPERPKRPMTAYFFYMSAMRDKLKIEMPTTLMKDISCIIAQKWNELPEADKAKYKDMSERARLDYDAALKKYEADMEAFRRANPEWVKEQEERKRLAALNATDDSSCSTSTGSCKKPRHLFNKVVKLNEEGRKEAGSDFEYYYVLTYLPDLQWCHLAPMRKVGVWGKNKPKLEGRPKWMLVNESEGKEVDISASVCEIVRSRAIRNNPDADKEQWDICESGPQAQASVLAMASKVSYTEGTELENGKSSHGSADCTSGTSSSAAKNDLATSATKSPQGPGKAAKAKGGLATPGQKTSTSLKKTVKASTTRGPATPVTSAKKKASAKKGSATPGASAKRTARGSGKKASAKVVGVASKPAKLASPFRLAKEVAAAKKKKEVPPEPEIVFAPPRLTRSGREFN